MSEHIFGNPRVSPIKDRPRPSAQARFPFPNANKLTAQLHRANVTSNSDIRPNMFGAIRRTTAATCDATAKLPLKAGALISRRGILVQTSTLLKIVLAGCRCPLAAARSREEIDGAIIPEGEQSAIPLHPRQTGSGQVSFGEDRSGNVGRTINIAIWGDDARIPRRIFCKHREQPCLIS